MKTKIITLLMILGVVSAANAYDFEEGGIFYNILSPKEKTVEVTFEKKKSATGLNLTVPSGAKQEIIVVPETVEHDGVSYTVTQIGKLAFGGCSSTQEIKLPKTITEIGEKAFLICHGLSEIVIPENVAKIGKQAFVMGVNEHNLTTVKLMPQTPPVCKESALKPEVALYVSEGSIEAYKAHKHWGTFMSISEIEDDTNDKGEGGSKSKGTTLLNLTPIFGTPTKSPVNKPVVIGKTTEQNLEDAASVGATASVAEESNSLPTTSATKKATFRHIEGGEQVIMNENVDTLVMKLTDKNKGDIYTPKFAKGFSPSDFKIYEKPCANLHFLLYNKELKPRNTSLRKLRKAEKFNPSKDDIHNIFYTYSDHAFYITILNKKGKAVDMSDFVFTSLSEHLKCEQNKISLIGNTVDYISGRYPLRGTVRISYKQADSDISMDLDARLTFHNSILSQEKNGDGANKSIAVCLIKNNIGEDLCAIIDLDGDSVQSGISILQLPITISVQGRNGKKGYNGSNGFNGNNESSWTDKNGKKHYTKGTCGSKGGNGGSGEDGHKGGCLLVLAPKDLMPYIKLNSKGGQGGKGGSGGRGGTHGLGSGCYGKAPDGLDGKDGEDGKDGGQILLPCNEDFFKQLFNTKNE